MSGRQPNMSLNLSGKPDFKLNHMIDLSFIIEYAKDTPVYYSISQMLRL